MRKILIAVVATLFVFGSMGFSGTALADQGGAPNEASNNTEGGSQNANDGNAGGNSGANGNDISGTPGNQGNDNVDAGNAGGPPD